MTVVSGTPGRFTARWFQTRRAVGTSSTGSGDGGSDIARLDYGFDTAAGDG
jgi:hypothetical protein